MQKFKALGIKDILAYRTHKGHFKILPDDLEIQETSQWEKVLDFRPDIAIVANPTSFHIETAKQIYPYVKGLFIDKPLAHNLNGIQDLYNDFESSRKNIFIGYNAPYHPIVKAINKALESDDFGKVISCQFTLGHWLPDWHPYEDYKSTFAARSDLGGGVALTLIHEIQLAHHFLGKADKVSGVFPSSDLLDLDVDTQANIMCNHRNGSVSQIHLDYIQKQWHREGILNCEKGHIYYNFRDGIVKGIAEGDSEYKILWHNTEYDYNQMFFDMMEMFLRYVKEGRIRHEHDLLHAFHDLAIVHAAFESFEKNIWAKPEKLETIGVSLYD